MTLRIKVAFQGGGARVIGLIAVAEVIAELERSGELQVTAVSGTSAGAIAAALLAGKADFAKLRHRLGELDEHITKTFAPVRGVLSPRLIWSILSGRPLYDYDRVIGLVSQLMSAAGVDPEKTIEDLTGPVRELRIVASDIRTSKKKVFSGGDRLIDAIAESTAIPLMFVRGAWVYRHGRSLDGAFFDNLPVRELLDIKTDDEIIAIGFKEPPATDGSHTLDLVRQLLSSMIGHQDGSSEALIGEQNVHRIKTDLKIWEFHRMVTPGLSKEYIDISKEARDFFQTTQKLWRGEEVEIPALKGSRSYRRLRELQDNVEELYNFLAPHQGGAVESAKYTVVANCLNTNLEPDVISFEQVVRCAETVYPHHRIRLTYSGWGRPELSHDVRINDQNGARVPYNASIMSRPSKNGQVLYLYFHLLVTPADLVGKRLFYTVNERTKDFMLPLRDGHDTLSVSALYRKMEFARITLHVPEAELAMIDLDTSQSVDAGRIQVINDAVVTCPGFKPICVEAHDVASPNGLLKVLYSRRRKAVL